MDRPLSFLRLPRRACLALHTHFALAFSRLQKCEKYNTCCAGYWLVENWSEDFLASKIGHQKRVKGAMQSYLLVHLKKLMWSSFHINSVPKTMVQFCCVRLYLGTELFPVAVCCYWWQGWTCTEDWKKRGHLFQVLCITQTDIFGKCSLIKWYFLHTPHVTLQEHFLTGQRQ